MVRGERTTEDCQDRRHRVRGAGAVQYAMYQGIGDSLGARNSEEADTRKPKYALHCTTAHRGHQRLVRSSNPRQWGTGAEQSRGRAVSEEHRPRACLKPTSRAGMCEARLPSDITTRQSKARWGEAAQNDWRGRSPRLRLRVTARDTAPAYDRQFCA